jgi:hypothetical protein
LFSIHYHVHKSFTLGHIQGQVSSRVILERNLNVKPEEVVDADHKGLRILCSEVEKTFKEMRARRLQEMMYLWKLSNCWEMMVST